jgi:hypothetical protein
VLLTSQEEVTDRPSGEVSDYKISKKKRSFYFSPANSGLA